MSQRAASQKNIKDALVQMDKKQILELCLQLTRFSKEIKELATYLIFDSHDEISFIKDVKVEIEEDFEAISNLSLYQSRKGVRKILTKLKKYIRYSKKKETEIELLLHFCATMRTNIPRYAKLKILDNLFDRQIIMIHNAIGKVHEDLQFEYKERVSAMLS